MEVCGTSLRGDHHSAHRTAQLNGRVEGTSGDATGGLNCFLSFVFGRMRRGASQPGGGVSFEARHTQYTSSACVPPCSLKKTEWTMLVRAQPAKVKWYYRLFVRATTGIHLDGPQSMRSTNEQSLLQVNLPNKVRNIVVVNWTSSKGRAVCYNRQGLGEDLDIHQRPRCPPSLWLEAKVKWTSLIVPFTFTKSARGLCKCKKQKKGKHKTMKGLCR